MKKFKKVNGFLVKDLCVLRSVFENELFKKMNFRCFKIFEGGYLIARTSWHWEDTIFTKEEYSTLRKLSIEAFVEFYREPGCNNPIEYAETANAQEAMKLGGIATVRSSLHFLENGDLVISKIHEVYYDSYDLFSTKLENEGDVIKIDIQRLKDRKWEAFKSYIAEQK